MFKQSYIAEVSRVRTCEIGYHTAYKTRKFILEILSLIWEIFDCLRLYPADLKRAEFILSPVKISTTVVLKYIKILILT